MSNGWVKLHRQVLDNPIFREDRTAWHIFETLLVLVNFETGTWSGGLFQLADLVGENKSTIYKAIKRLKKAKMVNALVNGNYTTYSICNWEIYQGDGKRSGKLLVNAEETLGKTLIRNKEVKNKEKTITNVIGLTPDDKSLEVVEEFGDPNINRVIEHFEKKFGKMSKQKLQRRAASTLIKRHGFEKVIGGINAAEACRGTPYSPNIGDLIELQEKWIKLETFYQKLSNESKGMFYAK